MGTGQTIALKVLSHSSADPIHFRRFFREARITSSLRSRHTIRVFDCGQDDDGVAYLAMELLNGRDLAAEIAARKRSGSWFSEPEILALATAICRSLGEAHAAGLVHRDLKPANLFLHRDPHEGDVVKVLDFGIARYKDQSASRVEVVGTVAYMSPEQGQGHSVDERSDLYSFGVVLYTLVAGNPPFAGETPMAVVFQHVHAPLPELRTRARLKPSDRLVSVIEALLAKDPEARFASAELVSEALNGTAPTGPPQSAMPDQPGSAMLSADELPTVNGSSVTAILATETKPLPAATGGTGRGVWRSFVAVAAAGLLGVMWHFAPVDWTLSGNSTPTLSLDRPAVSATAAVPSVSVPTLAPMPLAPVAGALWGRSAPAPPLGDLPAAATELMEVGKPKPLDARVATPEPAVGEIVAPAVPQQRDPGAENRVLQPAGPAVPRVRHPKRAGASAKLRTDQRRDAGPVPVSKASNELNRKPTADSLHVPMVKLPDTKRPNK